MKRIIALIIVILLLLTACSSKTEVSRELLDHDYTPAHDELITTYMYMPCGESFTVIPMTNKYHFDDKYELLYRIGYDDGSDAEIWEEVNEREYDNAVKELEGR